MTLPRKGVKAMGYFMLLWLFGWVILWIVVLYGMFMDSRWEAELVVFLVIAALAAVIVLRSLLWYFRGREVVCIGYGLFIIERHGSFLFPALRLKLEEVDGLALRTRNRLWLAKLLKGQDQMAVHYLGRQRYFGRWCSEQDALRALRELNTWLEEGKRASSHH